MWAQYKTQQGKETVQSFRRRWTQQEWTTQDDNKDFCKTLCSKKFYFYFLNADDNVVLQPVFIDYSPLISLKGASPSYRFKFPVHLPQFQELRITVSLSQQLCQQIYTKYLNPFEVCIIGAKDIPLDPSQTHLPTYVTYRFFDSSVVKTQALVTNGKAVWNQKHVFLLGLMDQTKLKQTFRTKLLKFQLHDRDVIVNSKPKNQLLLFDLTKQIQQQQEKYQPVIDDLKKKGAKKQAKKQSKDEKKQVKKDVKKDAKKKDVKIGQPILPPQTNQIKTTDYGLALFFLSDFLKSAVRQIKLKCPVVPVQKYEDIESKNVDLNTTAKIALQKSLATNNYFQNDTALVVSFKLFSQIGTFVKPVPAPQSVQSNKKTAKKQSKVQEEKKESILPSSQPVLKAQIQRAVFVIGYSNRERLKQIQDFVYKTNFKAFGLQESPSSVRLLSTRIFTAQQKASTSIDYISCFQLIDNQFRMFVLQGLADKSMKQLGSLFERLSPNSPQDKFLKNSKIRYMKRIYSDLGVQIKRIRLIKSLPLILIQPNLYIQSITSPQLCKNLNFLSEIRKAQNLKQIDSFELWPDSSVLIQIQRKFSISLSKQDIDGHEPKKDKSINSKQTNLNKITIDSFKNIQNAQNNVDQPGPAGQDKAIKETLNGSGYKSKLKCFIPVQKYQIRLINTNQPSSKPTYSNQKNNTYLNQLDQLRNKISSDKANTYTYSNQYLSASISPVCESQLKKKEIQQHKRLLNGRKQFIVGHRTQAQKNKLIKQPDQAKIHQLKFPYFQDQQRKKQLERDGRACPIKDPNKKQFTPYLGMLPYFSQLQKDRVLSQDQIELEKKQAKQNEQKAFRQKLKGDQTLKYKKGMPESLSQLDRIKGIREDPAVKKGLIIKPKGGSVQMQKYLANDPVSIFSHDQEQITFQSMVQRKEVAGRADKFDYYQGPEVITRTFIHKPLRGNGI